MNENANPVFSAVLDPKERARIAGRNLNALEEALGYSFKDRGRLEEALCHSSFSHEHGLYFNNERLEFLGDSVLGFAVARALYRMYPDATEGELTRMRAELVKGASLARRGEALGIPALILHGNSMKGDLPQSLCEDAVEAVLGAVCLDGGFSAAERVVKRLFLREAEEQAAVLDPKSQLQIWLQARECPLPHYELVSVTGPSHAPEFTALVRVNGVDRTATGTTRRGAESAAAALLLEALKSGEGHIPDKTKQEDGA
ncbi:MAG: ribonuclease III [Synergistaceae bacterium]|nr:ribonuclease III [Synergistaceae bacterium]